MRPFHEVLFDGDILPKALEASHLHDPFKGLNKPLKGDMNYYYDADIDIQKTQALVEYDKVLIETLEEIMSTIRWRHQNIGNIIKWRSFEAGT